MKELNLINKLLTIIFVSLALLLIDNDMVFLVLSSIGILYCLYSKKIMPLILFVISVVGYNIWNPFNLIYDFLLILGFIILVDSTFSIEQRQYLFDKTMYRLKSFKRTKKHLKKCYYNQCLSNNMAKMEKYNSLINSNFLNRQVVLKTNKDLNDMYLLFRLRFYQIYNKKTTLFPDRWKKCDTIYLLVLITVFCMTLCIR